MCNKKLYVPSTLSLFCGLFFPKPQLLMLPTADQEKPTSHDVSEKNSDPVPSNANLSSDPVRFPVIQRVDYVRHIV